MKVKRLVFAVLVLFLVLLMGSVSNAVDTRQIDVVLKKGVLDSQDLQIIDTFVGEAVGELMLAKDSTDIVAIRTAILSRQGNQAQYAQQFFDSSHKYISSGLQEASRLTAEDHKLIVTVNLLILIDGIEDPRLSELAIANLKDESTVVRYWAVHCVTSLGITQKLNSGEAAGLKLAGSIAEELKKLVDQSRPEIIALIARFAANINIQQAEELLLQIADMRMKRYVDWTVEYERLDGTILKLLYSKISSASPNNPAVARRFGQLYSYAIQRYIKGQGFLSDTQKQQLASVMVEIEDKCISSLLSKTQTAIKRAIEQDDITVLLQEHNSLLGDETTAGQLPLKLEFEYSSTGGSKTAPAPLPEPPQDQSQ